MIHDEEEAERFVRDLPECDDSAWEKLNGLVAMLVEESQRQNLVSAKSLEVVWRRHVADSAQLLCHVSRETSPWLDLGSGAGFPGLVVACLRPWVDVRLAEARPLRCEWLRRAANTLSMGNVHVAEGPVEQLDAFPAGAISARAFASLAKTVTTGARFSTSETLWVLPKGRSATHELHTLRGWNHTFHVEQSLTDTDAGIILGAVAGRKGRSR